MHLTWGLGWEHKFPEVLNQNLYSNKFLWWLYEPWSLVFKAPCRPLLIHLPFALLGVYFGARDEHPMSHCGLCPPGAAREAVQAWEGLWGQSCTLPGVLGIPSETSASLGQDEASERATCRKWCQVSQVKGGDWSCTGRGQLAEQLAVQTRGP